MATINDPTSKTPVTGSTMNVLTDKKKEEDNREGSAQRDDSSIPVSGGSKVGTISTAPSPRQVQKPASSGTFTNLQQYSEANKGAAQRMTQTATQNVAQQGKQIQQQVGQQAARTESDIEANQKKIEEEQKFANVLLNKAGTAVGQEDIESYEKSVLGKDYDKFKSEAAAIQKQEDLEALKKQYNLDYTYNPSEADYNRFRNIVTGQTQFNDVRDLDLSQQRVQAQQLQQLGQQAGTDQGRLALLMQTLGRGREYTRGQSGLDAALIARDAEARQALQQGIQQTAEQATGALTKAQTDILARRQALEDLNREYGTNIATEGEQETTDVMNAVNSGMIDLQTARSTLAKELGITEADAEARMKAMAQERLSLQSKGKVYGSSQYNSWSPVTSGFRYRNMLDAATEGIALSKDQKDALQLAGVDPTLTMTDAQRNWFRTRGYEPWMADSSAYNYNFLDTDVTGAGLQLRSAYDRMFGGEASALQKALGSEAIARQLAMSGANVEGVEGGINQLYKQLKEGKDIDLETAASIEQYRRYNALQDLLKGRDIGERSLRMSEAEKKAGKAAEQERLLREARAEAMRKFKIQGE
jgi:hypothetical protein